VTPYCCYIDLKAQKKFYVVGQFESSQVIICPPAHEYTNRAEFSLHICVPLNNTTQSMNMIYDNCDYYFQVEQYKLLVFKLPVFTNVSDAMNPVNSKSGPITLRGSGFELDFIQKKQKMACMFDGCGSGNIVEAKCISQKETESKELEAICTCAFPRNCKIRADETYKQFPILFSEYYTPNRNEVTFFNHTGHSITVYNEPLTISIEPNYSNYSGGTQCKIRGSGFFYSDLLSCQFGNIIVPATFNSSNMIECMSPPLKLMLEDNMVGDVKITVTVSENSKYFAFPGLAFTYLLEKECPFECLHGKCDMSKGICKCHKGWTGQRCEVSNSHEQISSIIWIIIMCCGVLAVVIFAFTLLLNLMYYRYRSKQYQRLIQERKYNDISTAL